MRYIKKNDSLWDLLNRDYISDRKQIISVVGAGGKTTTLIRLATELKKKCIQSIVMTTTKMYQPVDWCFIPTSPILSEDYSKNDNRYDTTFDVEDILSKVLEMLEKHGAVWIGAPLPNNKMTVVSSKLLRELIRLNVPIIIEADGAKMLPCKAPNEHEPVIIKETTLVLGIYGVDSIGKPIYSICHRPELVAKLLNVDLEHILTCEDIVNLVLDNQGLKKNVLPYMDFYFILNKVHTDNDFRLAMRIGKLLEKRGFYKFIFM